ncbi:MAG: tail fiber domain-containing protein, partial [Rhodothermales bacterium]
PDMSFNVRDASNALFIEAGTGDVGVGTTTPSHPLEVGTNTGNGNGAHVTAGGVWTNGSSRTFKTNFKNVDAHGVLERLAAVPVMEWEYRNSDEGRHMGPVAEDFFDAFNLGNDNRYIGTIDAAGVSMAAIQGLYELVREQQALITALTTRLDELERR